MKIKYKLGALIAFLGISLIGNSQSTNGTIANNNYNAIGFIGWTNTNGANPLNFRTNNINRMRLNGNETNNYFGFSHDVTGHLGIGLDNYFATNTPLTMLHLEGKNTTPFTAGQFRGWMRTGLFTRETSDAMYVGMKPEGFNRADAVVAWSDDNIGGGGGGPDNLRFIFLGTQTTLPGAINPLQGNSDNGYEVMRMINSGPSNQAGFQAGHVGIGPLFTDLLEPQNRLHLNAESGLATFMQVSNVAGGGLPGTGQTGTDGLKIGIQSTASTTGTRQHGYLQWQENTPFIVQTASTGAGTSTATGERLRVTSIGALNNTEGSFGALTTPANRTRIAISADGSDPITRPLSLLHLGYNTGAIAITPGTDGWRNWMDLGIFTTNGSDNVYLGLKQESGPVGDRQDAVLSWGDNQTSGLPPGNGPDNFRMIFTSTTATSGGGTAPATGVNGLEGMRMTPTTDDGVYTGIGGDPSAPNSYYGGSTNPTSTLEVNSWGQTADAGGSSGLRFTNLNSTSPTIGNPGRGVLSVDTTGTVIYVPYPNGLACWDLNGNGMNDTIEDINGDGLWNAQDCQGIAGTPGNCWDTNGNGVPDLNEDTNNDGLWNNLDCQGAPGIACWDLNGNGLPDANEDTNIDGLWNALDCQGTDGAPGVAGPAGPQGPAGPSIGAHNGTSMSILDPTKVAFGQNLNEAGAPGRLLNTREVPMNDNNIVFTSNAAIASPTTNRIGFGTNNPVAKVDIQLSTLASTASPTALRILNTQPASSGAAYGMTLNVAGSNNLNCGEQILVSPGTSGSTGIISTVQGPGTSSGNYMGLAASAIATGLPFWNIGLQGIARNGRMNIGADIAANGISGSHTNRAIQAQASGTGTSENIAVYAYTIGSGSTNYGLKAQVNIAGKTNYGVYSTGVGNAASRAGYFAGALQTTASVVQTSDQQFKTNVSALSGSLKLIQSMKPVSYYMDTLNYEEFNFDSKKQFGFIAQEVEVIFPNMVYNSTHPAQYDSTGAEIKPAVDYKSLNYTEMIPVNTAAIIELNRKVDAISLSDQSIKTNVQNLTGSLDKVLAMRGVSYDWDHTVHPELNLDSLNQVGFIAQEVQVIDSRLTFVADDSLLHVKYEKVVPILAEAIEELNEQVESKDSIINTLMNENSVQQNTIDDLNNRLTQLENCLSGILPYLCQLSHSAIQANTLETQEEVRKNLNVTLSNRNAIVLDQNVPNPFAEQTIINFSIPETVKKAQIHFYDGNGRFMNSVEVTERGLGSVTVFGSDLSTGVYTYTLVADGQVVATKKMMKQ